MPLPYGSVVLLASVILCAGGWGPAWSVRGVRVVYPVLLVIFLALHLARPWDLVMLGAVGAVVSWPTGQGVLWVALMVAVTDAFEAWAQAARVGFVAATVSLCVPRGFRALGPGLVGGALGSLALVSIDGRFPGTAQTVVAGALLGAWIRWGIARWRVRRQEAEAEPWPS